MVPSARNVDTTARPFSAAASATASSSVVIGTPSVEDDCHRTAFGTHSDWWAPCRCSGWRRKRRCWPPSAPSGRAGRRHRPPRRRRADRIPPRRKQLLDDGRDDRCARRQCPHHRVLGVAECRLGFDGHRRVVDVPARQPRRLVEVIGSAQQRDVGQAGGALAGHGVRWRQRYRFGDQIGRHLVALLFQQGRCAAHLLAVGLLGPQADERDHRRVQRRQRHQGVAHDVIAHIDRQARHADIE